MQHFHQRRRKNEVILRNSSKGRLKKGDLRSSRKRKGKETSPICQSQKYQPFHYAKEGKKRLLFRNGKGGRERGKQCIFRQRGLGEEPARIFAGLHWKGEKEAPPFLFKERGEERKGGNISLRRGGWPPGRNLDKKGKALHRPRKRREGKRRTTKPSTFSLSRKLQSQALSWTKRKKKEKDCFPVAYWQKEKKGKSLALIVRDFVTGSARRETGPSDLLRHLRKGRKEKGKRGEGDS